MKKIEHSPILITIITVLILVTASISVSTVMVRNRLAGENRGGKWINIDEKYQGKLSVNTDNLNILILFLKNPNIENSEQFEIGLYEGNNLIRSMVFNGANVGDPSDLRFQFEPISDSQSTEYDLVIETIKSDRPVSINVNDNNSFAYRTYYRSSIRNNINKYVGRIIESVMGDKGFIMVWGAIILLVGIVYRKYV